MDNRKYTSNDIIMKRQSSTFGNKWRDSTPIGSGVTGALLYGGISEESIILNRGDLWTGAVNAAVPDVSYCLEEMRNLQKQGKYPEANFLMYNELVKQNYGNCLADMRALGRVKISFSCPGLFSNYRRVIHADTAETEISYYIEKDFYKRKYIASRKRDIIAMEFTAEAESSVVLNSGFHRSFEGGRELEIQKSDEENASYRVVGDCHVYSSCHEGKFFGIVCRIVSDGDITVSEKSISVSDAKHALVLIKAFSEEENRIDGENKTIAALTDCPDDYNTIFEENLPLYQKLYNTADIKLYNSETFHSNEELISSAQDTEMSAELAEKLWRFGRYLFISGTSENALPFPLYGLWTSGYNRNFTHHVANENVQSIYWHTDAGGLSSLTVSLINYYYEKMEFFRENARQLYGCRGIFAGTYTTPKNSTVSWEVPVILHFNGVAGWLSQHFYKYYLYTNDTKLFEEKILPFMLEAALFYEDFYYTDETGKLVLYPAVSPENSPMEYRNPLTGHAMPTTKNPTVEIAILKELLNNLIKISKTHPEISHKVESWEYMLSIMPEYRINEDGAIAEWIAPEHSDDYDHRHLSHIYPIFPGTELEDTGRKDLLPAFKRAADLRADGNSCGWSMPHISAIYARFGDGEKAFYRLNILAKLCLLENFFTLGHDFRDTGLTGLIFFDEVTADVQLDALMGAVNALQEMLIFSTEKILRILPACTKKFGHGSATLRFYTGIAEIKWNLSEKSCHGNITALRDTDVTLELPFNKSPQKLLLKAGEKFEF